ncbi:MAG: Uma2 family endonuclease, partial [Pirellulaceae bacterium]
VEPDGMFVSQAAMKSKRVWFEEGAESLEVIGTPDMVLEVVSSHTVKKDTVVLRKLYAEAGIAEYWLVNPLKGAVTFDVLRLTASGYVATPKNSGWVKSRVFGKSFRLAVRKAGDKLPDVRLLVR